MASEVAPESEDEPTPEPAKKSGIVVLLLVALVAGAGGFVVPYVIGAMSPEEATEEEADKAPSDEDPQYVPFGEVTVNLNEGRFNRYLRLSITLQVGSSDQEEVAKLIEERRVVLKNWLISHLSDKNMEDIRGAAGQNMLRREILEEFNVTLFSDGYDRIFDVLFEEFNVQ